MTSEPARVPARTILATIGLVLATGLAVLFVIQVQRVLVWMLVAGFFTITLYPVVAWVQRRLGWCPRWLATLSVFLLVFLLLGGLLTMFAVPLAQEGIQLAGQLPGIVGDARAGRHPGCAPGHPGSRHHPGGRARRLGQPARPTQAAADPRRGPGTSGRQARRRAGVNRQPLLCLDNALVTVEMTKPTVHPWIRLLCPAHSFSRSATFCGLPVAVRGSWSTNSTDFGTLKRAMRVCR